MRFFLQYFSSEKHLAATKKYYSKNFQNKIIIAVLLFDKAVVVVDTLLQ